MNEIRFIHKVLSLLQSCYLQVLPITNPLYIYALIKRGLPFLLSFLSYLCYPEGEKKKERQKRKGLIISSNVTITFSPLFLAHPLIKKQRK